MPTDNNQVENKVSLYSMLIDKLEKINDSSIAVPLNFDQLLEFGKKSNEVFEGLEKANAQLLAGLQSTHSAAGISMKDLEQWQTDLRSKVDYSRSAIADMQVQLLTFPSITADQFAKASQSVLDMSTKLHGDLKQTAVTVGKAMQDPAKGIEALSNAGAYFNNVQIEMVKKLAETGKAREAQLIILKQLQDDFSGSAAAAAETNPFFEYDRSIEDLQVDIGKTISELKQSASPYLTELAGDFRNVWDWTTKQKELLYDVAQLVRTTAEAFVAYKLSQIALLAITKANVLWTDLQWQSISILGDKYLTANTAQVAFAGTAATLKGVLNGLLTPANALAASLFLIYKNYEAIKDFRNVTLPELTEKQKNADNATVETQIQTEYFFSKGKNKEEKRESAIETLRKKYQGFVDEDQQKADGLKKYHDALLGTDALKYLASGFGIQVPKLEVDKKSEEYIQTLAYLQHDKQKLGYLTNIAPAGASGGATKIGSNTPVFDNKDTKPTAAKATTINIKINDLVKELNLHSTTIQGGARQIKDIITEVLLSAVNDSQQIAHD